MVLIGHFGMILSMIARIDGILESVEADAALVRTEGGLTYRVLLPAYAATRLAGSAGQPITLHTLQFFESQAQGATIFPRLAGFHSTQDRAFYELFVTVKGIGHRRALRAMALEPARIAAAVADRDIKLLQTLPEVGRRTAETIAVTLKDKVDHFASAAAYPDHADAAASLRPAGRLPREALEVLLQLGENRAEAVTLIDRALAEDDVPADVQAVVQAVYRLKTSV